LLIWALAPVILTEILDEWLVALVDHSVKGCDGVLRDFSENDVTIGGSLADVFLWNRVGIGCSNEIDTLTNELVFLTI
jgi:hypothetical protein